MSILAVYIAVTKDPLLVHNASRFAATYKEYPPGVPHRLIVACNGGELSPKNKAIFDGLPAEFYPRENDGGWDISAYQEVAREFESDLQVCLGASVYFHQRGWLARLVDCWSKHGPGMYGCFSSFLVRPHLNTTAFAVDTQLLKLSSPVDSKSERYSFEHGVKAFWRRIAFTGNQTRLVTWDGCWEPKDWRKPKAILWRGDQSNCLVYCNHVDKFNGATPQVQQRWARGADSLCP